MKNEDTSSLQQKVVSWMDACFGDGPARDATERNHRFLEEALEMVQACGATAEECRLLVDYVFSRPSGEKQSEAGGVLVTLAALCAAHDIDMQAAGEAEVARIWEKIDMIREKQKSKPHSYYRRDREDAAE